MVVVTIGSFVVVFLLFRQFVFESELESMQPNLHERITKKIAPTIIKLICGKNFIFRLKEMLNPPRTTTYK